MVVELLTRSPLLHFLQMLMSLYLHSGLTRLLITQMERLPEQHQLHKQSLAIAQQLLRLTQAPSHLLAEYSLGGIQEPMDQELHTLVAKRDLAIMET
jgi:hypothetical protein